MGDILGLNGAISAWPPVLATHYLALMDMVKLEPMSMSDKSMESDYWYDLPCQTDQ